MALFFKRRSTSLWRTVEISRSHMNPARCVFLFISADTEGRMTASGYCTDRDGKRWSAEAPVTLSERESASLRNLDFAGLPHSTRRHRFFRQAPDQTVDRLIVTYGDGRQERKVLPNELLETVTILFTEALEKEEKGEQEL